MGNSALHLDEGAHVGEMCVHRASVWEVVIHPLHELGEAAEGHGLWRAVTAQGGWRRDSLRCCVNANGRLTSQV